LPHRDPDPLGLRRHRRRPRPDQGRQLARQRADAVRRRRQLADAGVQGVPGEHREDRMNEAAVASLANEAWAPRRRPAPPRRRRRARLLAERYAFAAELLRLYEALLDVQEPAFMTARNDRPDPAELAAYAADRVMSGVIDATLKAGPTALGAAVRERRRDGDL